MASAAARPFALRHGLLTSFKPPILTQRRHARALDIRFVQTRTLPAVFEKYRSQLSAKGVTSLSQLASKAHSVAPSPPQPLSPPPPPPPPAILSHPPPPPPIPVTTTAQTKGIKTLSSYVDVSKLRALPTTKEIEYIWRTRFVADPQSLCAVVPRSKYILMEADAKLHPMFILPLPREGQGVEMHFLQWSFPGRQTSTVIFTSLAEYRLRGEWATPHTTVTHHLELAEEKGAVLSQGAVGEGVGVTVDEARWLVVALQKFYGADGGSEVGRRRRRLLEQFTNGDPDFRVERLIGEVEMIE